MTNAEADHRAEAGANELYWGSGMSVNQIAEELDLSKGALYGLIHPRPSGLACPTCAEEVVHPNRTARDRAMVSCPGCGWEGTEEEADATAGERDLLLPEGVEAEPGLRSTTLDGRSRAIFGGALLGAAAGLALVLWARRR